MKQEKKPFPSPGYRSARFAVQFIFIFFFLSPNLEPGPRLVVSQQLKKTDPKRTQTNYHYMGLEYQGIRGTTYLVGIRSKVYQRLRD